MLLRRRCGFDSNEAVKSVGDAADTESRGAPTRNDLWWWDDDGRADPEDEDKGGDDEDDDDVDEDGAGGGGRDGGAKPAAAWDGASDKGPSSARRLDWNERRRWEEDAMETGEWNRKSVSSAWRRSCASRTSESRSLR